MVLKAKCLLKVVICSYILWGSETGLYKAPETFHYAAAQWESLSERVTAQECVGTGRDGQRQSSTAESGGRRTSTVLSHVPLRIRVFLAHPWTISEQVVCYAARPTCWPLHTTAFSSPEKHTGKKIFCFITSHHRYFNTCLKQTTVSFWTLHSASRSHLELVPCTILNFEISLLAFKALHSLWCTTSLIF